jgi:hypothetical protein
MDAVIKATATAKVIPSAEAIAKEVMKQQREQEIQQNGTRAPRERWMENRNEVDNARDAGLTYESNEEGERVISRPLCVEFGDFVLGKVGTIKLGRRACDMRKAIMKLLQGRTHADALEARQKELRQNVRRTRIGLNTVRTGLQTLREVSSFVQFEMKLRDLYLVGLDIGSMNHSREFMRKFVESMSTVMDRKIGSRLKAVDPITRRKRVFLFMADKVTKLHRG